MGALSLLTPLAVQAIGCPSTEGVKGLPNLVDIDPTLPVGQVVGSATGTFATGSTSCNIIHQGLDTHMLTGIGTPSGNLYPTSIPGLAYRGTLLSGGSFVGNVTGTWPKAAVFADQSLGGNSYYGGNIRIDFIKTGPIQPGTFGPVTLGRWTINNQQFLNFVLLDRVTVAPTTPACTVTQSAITVNLRNTTIDELTTLGDTSQETAFNLPLRCNSATNISLGFSGNLADSTNAVFSNLSDSTNTTGVGVQILKDGTPIPATAGNYLNLGVVNGSLSVPLTARYYALAGKPTPGDVSAVAYASIVYN